MARVGVFGGSFNPVHLGHLHVAVLAQEAACLDRVLFVPARTPPHKNGEDLAAEEHRVEMLRLAVGPVEGWDVDSLELQAGASPYTVDTLDALARRSPDHTHVFIMGWDSLRDFAAWRDPEGILERHEVVAVDRPGVSAEVQERYASGMKLVRGNPLGITSTGIRRCLARGTSVRYLVPDAVDAYLRAASLYRIS